MLVDYLINRARSFIFSTAPAPAAAAAARAAVDLVQSDEGRRRCEQLWARVAECSAGTLPELRTGARKTGAARSSPILPLIIGDEAEAVRVASALLDHGILLPAIRYPAVARGSARLRLTLSAGHTAEDLARLRQALAAVVPRSAFRVPQ